MGTAKFYEDKLERLHADLVALKGDQPHPSIQALRAMPVDRAPNAREIAAREKRKQQYAAKKASQAEKATRKKEFVDQKLAENADATLRLQNVRLLKHIRLLESVVKKQAAEIAVLKGKS